MGQIQLCAVKPRQSTRNEQIKLNMQNPNLRPCVNFGRRSYGPPPQMTLGKRVRDAATTLRTATVGKTALYRRYLADSPSACGAHVGG